MDLDLGPTVRGWIHHLITSLLPSEAFPVLHCPPPAKQGLPLLLLIVIADMPGKPTYAQYFMHPNLEGKG